MSQHYDMLHVTPPMCTPAVLGENKDLVNEAGYLEVNQETLQHVRYQMGRDTKGKKETGKKWVKGKKKG